MSSISPIELPARRLMRLVPLSFLLCITVMLVVMNFSLLQPVSDKMLDVQHTMCSDDTNLNFIFGQNALGWLIYAKALPYSAEIKDHTSNEVMLDSVQRIIDKDPQVSKFVFDLSQTDITQNLGVLRSEAGRSLPDLTSDRQCLDFKPESFDGMHLGELLYTATGMATLRQVSTCGEVKEYCRGRTDLLVSQNVRFLCPVTCGCADSFSGLWDLAAPDAGCPRKKCDEDMQKNLSADATCKDMDLEQLSSTTWSFLLTHMQESSSFNVSVFNNLTSKGCEALRHLDDSLRSSLCAHTNSFLGAGAMCPVTCGCMKGHRRFLAKQTENRFGISCPQSCDNQYQCMKLGPASVAFSSTIGTRVDCPTRCQDVVLLEGWDCPLVCDETLYGERGGGYRGCQNVTRSGHTCQMWVSRAPHSHDYIPSELYPDVEKYGGLGYHNYCRNPDNDVSTSSIWCYTADPSVRWEYCDPVGEQQGGNNDKDVPTTIR